MRVLIVEDEPIVSLDIEHTLRSAGHQVVGTAASVRRAIDLLGSSQCNLVVLDTNLGGESAAPVAEQLRECGITYICLTGYSAHRLPCAMRGAPVLAKPFEPDRLLAVIDAALRREKRVQHSPVVQQTRPE